MLYFRAEVFYFHCKIFWNGALLQGYLSSRCGLGALQRVSGVTSLPHRGLSWWAELRKQIVYALRAEATNGNGCLIVAELSMSQSKVQILNPPLFDCCPAESLWKFIGTSISTMRILRRQDDPFREPVHWCLCANWLSLPSRKVETEIQVSVSPHSHCWTMDIPPWSTWVLLHLASFLWRHLSTRGGCSQGFCSHQAQLWKVYCVLSQRMIISMTALPSQRGDKSCHLGSSIQSA